MPGPPKKPTAMLKKRGSRLVDKRKNEITPPAGAPEAPSWMLIKSGRGKKKLTVTEKKFNRITQAEWNSKTKQLLAMGVLTEWEQTPLAMFCQAIAEYVIVTDQIDLKNMVYETDKGNYAQDPIVGVRNRVFKKVVELAKQFGMTPASRAGLSVAPKAPTQTGVERKHFPRAQIA